MSNKNLVGLNYPDIYKYLKNLIENSKNNSTLYKNSDLRKNASINMIKAQAKLNFESNNEKKIINHLLENNTELSELFKSIKIESYLFYLIEDRKTNTLYTEGIMKKNASINMLKKNAKLTFNSNKEKKLINHLLEPYSPLSELFRAYFPTKIESHLKNLIENPKTTTLYTQGILKRKASINMLKEQAKLTFISNKEKEFINHLFKPKSDLSELFKETKQYHKDKKGARISELTDVNPKLILQSTVEEVDYMKLGQENKDIIGDIIKKWLKEINPKQDSYASFKGIAYLIVYFPNMQNIQITVNNKNTKNTKNTTITKTLQEWYHEGKDKHENFTEEFEIISSLLPKVMKEEQLTGDDKEYIKLQNGPKRLLRTGPKGGKYYMKGGNKVYIK